MCMSLPALDGAIIVVRTLLRSQVSVCNSFLNSRYRATVAESNLNTQWVVIGYITCDNDTIHSACPLNRSMFVQITPQRRPIARP